MTTLNAHDAAAAEAAQFARATQAALGTMQEAGAELGAALVMAGTGGAAAQVDAAATDARARLGSVVSALNARDAGRALFAGTATDGAAVAGADDLLAQLAADIGPQASAADLAAAVNDWFDAPGGGFYTHGYLGAGTDLSPASIAPGQTADPALRADDPALRELLAGYATAALLDRGLLDGQADQRAAALLLAGTRIMEGDAALATLGARVGREEARIEEAATANAAEAAALEEARAALVGVDAYRTATALTEAETQLETLYAVTARLSRLSLTEFLR
jgi:flagellar hook-associated protein 3 FlgL